MSTMYEQKPTIHRLFLLALVLLTSWLGSGCASVQAWEKGALAKREMTFASDRLSQRFAEHIYASKEAANGGSSVGGGGCGCN